MNHIPIMLPYFTEDEAKAVSETLKTGWVAQGPRVAEFEAAVAQYEGVAYGIATTSCTTALHLLLVSLGVGSGMDVIVPSYTFIATANAVTYTGATAMLTDVSTDTYNIDPEEFENLIKFRYKDGINLKTGNKLFGVIAVHLFGLCADMPCINALATKYGFRVVEDAACALGASISGKREGTFGNPSCLSFHPRKSITTGEGGMVLTDDEALAARMRALRSHGASISETQRHSSKGYLLPDYDDLGFNYRMTDIQATVGLAQMKKIDYIADRRRELSARYDKLLPQFAPYLRTPFVPEGYGHAYQSYVTMLRANKQSKEHIDAMNARRNALMDALEQNGIMTRQGTHAVHTLGYYKENFGYNDCDCLGAYACDRLSLALPLYAGMTNEEQDIVLEKLQTLYEE